MTKKQFWRNASNMGFVGGMALVGVNIVGWALRLETIHAGWPYELLLFAAICPLILVTGRRNAALAGAEGYPFGRAMGYVFALMMFAGIVYGAGRFLLVNFIARDFYDAFNATSIEAAMQLYRGTPLESQAEAMRGQMVRMLANPFVIIVSSVVSFVFKGGFLGLILAPIFTRKPDMFADRSGDGSHE